MSRAALALALLCFGCSESERAEPAKPVDPKRVIVPAELADEAALARFSGLSSLPSPARVGRGHQNSGERPGGGPPTLTYVAPGNRDMNNFVCRSADAAIADEQVVPYVFDEDTCAERYVRGAVLSRFEGSGELVRLWMTAFSLPHMPFDDEILRLYVDDDPVPRVQASLAAVVDGLLGEMFAPPFGLGANDRLAWRYPVVFAKKLIVAVDGLGPFDLYYHQSDVLLSDGPRSASQSRLPARDLAIASATTPETFPPLGPPIELSLAPGQSVDAADMKGPVTVQSARVESSSELADLWLTLEVDGVTTASLPLLELFAASATSPTGRTLALGPGLELRLPIPSASRQIWSVENRGSQSASLALHFTGESSAPAAPFRTLHVVRHETAAAAATHPIAKVEGSGRLAGVCLTLAGRTGEGFTDPFNFLEGDERFTLDGDRTAGTGTEDYLDGAFYFFTGAFASPFAAAWGIASGGSQGQVTGCRWHLLSDVVEYESGLDLELEVGASAPDLLERYRSVAFVYR